MVFLTVKLHTTTFTLPIPKWSFKHFPEIEQKYSQISITTNV